LLIFNFRIKDGRDCYDILGFKNTATVSLIKKSYKKLALLLHSDKNSAPDSEEVLFVRK